MSEQERFRSDIHLRFYGDGRPLDLSEIDKDVRAYFGEKLFKPRRERVKIGKDGRLDPNYIFHMQRAIEYWSKEEDWAAVERFQSELDGVNNVVKLVTQSHETGCMLPIVVNASDPGDFYVNDGGYKKSLTYVWTLEKETIDAWEYRVFSIPTEHIGLEKHWELLKKISNLQVTGRMLKTILSESEVNPLSMIAYPVVVDQYAHNLDSIAKELGFASWDEIEKQANNQLALELDPTAPKRRERIIENFKLRIWHAIKQNKDREYLKALENAMADTMAVEAGENKYIGMDERQIDEQIKKNLQVSLAMQYRVSSHYNYFTYKLSGIKSEQDLREIEQHAMWLRNEFQTNEKVRQAKATGCGGAGNNYSNIGIFIDSRIAMFREDHFAEFMNYEGKFGELNEYKITESGEPEGRYIDGIYTPGICVSCHQERQKVWKVEDGGCGCCTTCEWEEFAGGD